MAPWHGEGCRLEVTCPIGESPDKCLAGVCDECYQYRQRAALREKWMALWIGIGLTLGMIMALKFVAEVIVRSVT